MISFSDLKDGDYVSWKYIDPQQEMSPHAYWCKDGKAIVHDGKIYDTYWLSLGTTGSFPTQLTLPSVIDSMVTTLVPSEHKVEKILCNINEMCTIRQSEFSLYNENDACVFSTQHGTKLFYTVRIGAAVDMEKVLQCITQKQKEIEANISSSEMKLVNIKRLIDEIQESGTVTRDQLFYNYLI